MAFSAAAFARNRAVVWVSSECLLEVHDTSVQRVLRSLVEIISPLQVILVSFGVDWVRGCQTRLLGGREADLDSFGVSRGDFFLYGENVSLFWLLFFGPNLLVICG